MDSFCDIILEKIEHRLIQLDCPTDIVRFSFIVQNSILPLDLAWQDSRNSFGEDALYGFSSFSVLDGCVQYPKFLINTEEKCRKILSTTRSFLYRLHLDLPKMRECGLKDGPEPANMLGCISRHIGKIIVDPNFHFTVLSCLVKEAVRRSDEKLKLIKWLVTFNALPEDVYLNPDHVNYFVKYLYPEVTDSAFIMSFLKKFNFNLWMVRSERSEYLEYFLFHLRQNGCTDKGNNACPYELIEMCIHWQSFLKMGSILKYQDAPRVPQRNIVWSMYTCSFDREGPIRNLLAEAEKRMSPRRFYFLVQIIYIFFERPTASAAECIRLLWRSLPDAFFSFEEIEIALKAGLSSETIQDVYNFYSRAVGAYHALVEPRSLKNLCRPAVRRMLWDSGCWIPDVIKLTGVPRGLESFLNLED
ncbi:unnamed protein product [Larinioides sclopetarius]|uniref:SOCS box domain-containing protein n=1 Tax=Larinioides sclopetarius TaxID=280406 RepID=A0AAV1ZGT1_9ARAC